MAKHKAPSEVTVAPLFEKSTAEQVLDKIKVPAGIVAVVIIGFVLMRHFNTKNTARALDQSWAALIERTSPDPFTRLPSAEPEVLANLASELKDSESGPWARLLEIHRRIDDRDYQGALGAIAQLRQDHPKHTLVTSAFPAGEGDTTVVDHLESSVQARMEWEDAHPALFENAPPPEGSPKVSIVTTAGTIEVTLYADAAPKHVENFLKLCGEGFYDGTKFHRVMRGFMIQGGDPNSREDDVTQWGQGGAGYTLAPEKNDLYHFPGVLSAAKKPGDIESSGCQFFITTDPAHHLDGQHVVFGAVTSGMQVVAAIGGGVIDPSTADRPSAPVTVTGTQVQ